MTDAWFHQYHTGLPGPSCPGCVKRAQEERQIEFAYVAFNVKGEIRAWSLDDQKSEKQNAELVREWLKMGRRIELLTLTDLRARITARHGPKHSSA
jgi:hypothetical protein